ncbi:gluconate 2-dehydrogenase subunit 3 family protein [Pseudomonas sp. 21LCFQ02]|uniref:gluconate 2-dehydrogenase subunit 3 family protein n=2 Tax=Pseudomonas TaxID=286 RepID=UPI0005EE9A8C|nr:MULTISPECIES: gluconate 2-dehydrogenase subunit 3 family protein [unclassified Pseudomonas]MCO8166088.1 gluconate 2-dehydrogenase subunit 3 family protein [Pseudomonas sp. 21LCFQ010]MCO8171781.1 gluconate 2-dehydrogenase subunit 3 family protein [Pseudomonas sp. 21LCFQ02]
MLLNKPTSRRKFLLSSLIALPAMGVTVKGLSAAAAAEMIAPGLDTYAPTFFSPGEWAFVLAATDRLIPAEGRGPGALETNVPVFIDQQLASDLGSEIYLEGPFPANPPPTMGYQIPFTPQQIYRTAIKAVNAWCQEKHRDNFAVLDAPVQNDVLKKLQSGEVDFRAYGEDILKSKQFFGELLGHTKQGYLADPIYGGNKGMKAWIAIGFPGARASYVEWVTQHNVKYPLGPVSVSGQRG